ncbi:hypothetical protein [Limnoglobus roseus]|uniref:Uncharacterized protein n=1 Tax=Limnoglobus roseus TaxID=2598579 RepID=A0A5C1AH64_9BACT|nr:hypothetical protein [Limnoglobus roseus]QEL17082.1 hypothetical protein PX52LOC_04058 [Limnoglobus roseus]
MFGFGTTKRSATASHERTKLMGVDLTASRVRAIAAAGGHINAVTLDDAQDELPLFINLERRTPEVGRQGYSICRTLPHLVCANFLPQLGQVREWRGNRVSLTPESALAATFDKLRGPLTAEADGGVLVVPSYLAAPQMKALWALAMKAKLPLTGTGSAPLAIVSHRANAFLAPRKQSPSAPKEEKSSWVVPIRPQAGGPGAVVIVDADEYALSAAVVNVQPGEARLLHLATWPRLSLKAWKDRLIDAASDRCVRLCRRDPRDSATAEQALFEQLDVALDRIRHAQPVTLSVRTEKWYQDIVQQPTDFDAHCAPLIKLATEEMRNLFAGAGLAIPPRGIWLTDTAAKLPGLAAAVYQNSAEQTEVSVLPPDAATEAAAALHARWLAGTLPRVHLDGVIAWEVPPPAKPRPETRGQRSV